MKGSYNRSTRYDGSLSRARSEVEHYQSAYNKAVKKFCCDPDRRSLDVLSAYSRSFIETLGDLSAPERTEADETMVLEAQEGLTLWPVFLAFVHSTNPAETLLEADKLEGRETLGKLERELLDSAKDHTYPTEIHSRDDWKVRLITAVYAAGTSLDDWTSDTLGRFFKLHREYSLNNLVQMDRLMRAAQGTYRARRVPRAGSGQGVKKPQKRR